jgi:hypothetical protein
MLIRHDDGFQLYRLDQSPFVHIVTFTVNEALATLVLCHEPAAVSCSSPCVSGQDCGSPFPVT